MTLCIPYIWVITDFHHCSIYAYKTWPRPTDFFEKKNIFEMYDTSCKLQTIENFMNVKFVTSVCVYGSVSETTIVIAKTNAM